MQSTAGAHCDPLSEDNSQVRCNQDAPRRAAVAPLTRFPATPGQEFVDEPLSTSGSQRRADGAQSAHSRPPSAQPDANAARGFPLPSRARRPSTLLNWSAQSDGPLSLATSQSLGESEAAVDDGEGGGVAGSWSYRTIMKKKSVVTLLPHDEEKDAAVDSGMHLHGGCEPARSTASAPPQRSTTFGPHNNNNNNMPAMGQPVSLTSSFVTSESSGLVSPANTTTTTTTTTNSSPETMARNLGSPPPPHVAAPRHRRHNPYSRSTDDEGDAVVRSPTTAVQVPPHATLLGAAQSSQHPLSAHGPSEPDAFPLQRIESHASVQSDASSASLPAGVNSGGSSPGVGAPLSAAKTPVACASGGYGANMNMSSSGGGGAVLGGGTRFAADPALTLSVPLPASSSQTEPLLDLQCEELTSNARSRPSLSSVTPTLAPSASGHDAQLSGSDFLRNDQSGIRVVIRRDRHTSGGSSTVLPLTGPGASHDASITRLVMTSSTTTNNNNSNTGGNNSSVKVAPLMMTTTTTTTTRNNSVNVNSTSNTHRAHSAGEVTNEVVRGVAKADAHRVPLQTSPNALLVAPLSAVAVPDDGSSAREDGNTNSNNASGFHPWWGTTPSPSLRGRGASTCNSAATSRASSLASSHLLRDAYPMSSVDAAQDYVSSGSSVPLPISSSAFRLTSPSDNSTTPGSGSHVVVAVPPYVDATGRQPSASRVQGPHYYAPAGQLVMSGHANYLSPSSNNNSDSSDGDAAAAARQSPRPGTGPHFGNGGGGGGGGGGAMNAAENFQTPQHVPHHHRRHSYLPTVDVEENVSGDNIDVLRPSLRSASMPGALVLDPHAAARAGGVAGAGAGAAAAGGVSQPMAQHQLQNMTMMNPMMTNHQHHQPMAPAMPAAAVTSPTASSTPTPTTSPFCHTPQSTNVGDRRSARASLRSTGLVLSGNDAPLSVPTPRLPNWQSDGTRSTTGTPLSTSVGFAAVGALGRSFHDSRRPTSISNTQSAACNGGAGQERAIFSVSSAATGLVSDDYTFDCHSNSANFEEAGASLSSGPNMYSNFLFSYGASSDEERSETSATPYTRMKSGAGGSSSSNVTARLSARDGRRPLTSFPSPPQPAMLPRATSPTPAWLARGGADVTGAGATQPSQPPHAQGHPYAPPPQPQHLHHHHQQQQQPQRTQRTQRQQPPTSQEQYVAPQQQHMQTQYQPLPPQHLAQHQYCPQPEGAQSMAMLATHGMALQGRDGGPQVAMPANTAAAPQTPTPYGWSSGPNDANSYRVPEVNSAQSVPYPARPDVSSSAPPLQPAYPGTTPGRAPMVMPSSMPPPLSPYAPAGGPMDEAPMRFPTLPSPHAHHTSSAASTASTVAPARGSYSAPPAEPMAGSFNGGASPQPYTQMQRQAPPPLSQHAVHQHHHHEIASPAAMLSDPHAQFTAPAAGVVAAAAPPSPSCGNGTCSPRDAPSSTSAQGRPAVDPRVAAGSAPTVSADALEKMRSAAPSDNIRCPPGWHFSVYNFSMDQHYSLPSNDVFITQGAIKYLQLFERHGMQTRFRFQVCRRFMTHKCDQGSQCLYIHTAVPLNATRIHINENTLSAAQQQQQQQQRGSRRASNGNGIIGGTNTKGYATLEPGFVVEVRAPNQGTEPPQRIPSEMILRTHGSNSLSLSSEPSSSDISARCGGSVVSPDVDSNNNNLAGRPLLTSAAAKKLRHCAHFQFKGVCNLGEDCSFIHSLVPYIQGR